MRMQFTFSLEITLRASKEEMHITVNDISGTSQIVADSLPIRVPVSRRIVILPLTDLELVSRQRVCKRYRENRFRLL